MLSALIVDDSQTQASTQGLIQMLRAVKSCADITVISTRVEAQPAASSTTPCNWITANNLIDGLAQAINAVSSKRVLIISSTLSFEANDLSRMAAELENSSVLEHTIYEPCAGRSILELPEMRSDSIVESLQNNSTWPMVCVATTRYALSATRPTTCASVAEYIAQTLILSLSDGDLIRSSRVANPAISSSDAARLTELSSEALARCLNCAVGTMNIEELFPRHNWLSYSKESAAASYHSLAALFLRFGDATAAAQCLQCSESLEESPRYFALKGLIQNSTGETLGAVANLVSSLQVYESRKVNDGSHYLSFAPSNLELVNTYLADGLGALNDKDNSRAIALFSEAVFNFDPFYAQHGVEEAIKALS